MTMIPAPAGTYALYLSKPDKDGHRLKDYQPVIAFNDEGRPMIMLTGTGRLADAALVKSEGKSLKLCVVPRGHDRSPGRNQYTSIIPGGEWLVDIEVGDRTTTRPVDFWAITETGEIVPILITEEGKNWNVTKDSSFRRLHRPGTAQSSS